MSYGFGKQPIFGRYLIHRRRQQCFVDEIESDGQLSFPIKVDGRGDFPYVHFADSAPRVGDWVLAVGNPYGLGGTVTAGIISARGRDIGSGPYDDFLQIDAPVNKGNWGRPRL
jgi:hypothetical protein